MNHRKFRHAPAVLALGLLASLPARAADAPPPFEGRLDEVAVAARRVTVDGVTYALSSTVRVEDAAGKPVPLRAGHAGMRVRVGVAAAEAGSSGPAPVLILTLLND